MWIVVVDVSLPVVDIFILDPTDGLIHLKKKKESTQTDTSLDYDDRISLISCLNLTELFILFYFIFLKCAKWNYVELYLKKFTPGAFV